MNTTDMPPENRKLHAPYVWLEVDLKAIQNNYQVFRQFVAPAKCAAVLKANAYGVGADELSTALFNVGCRHMFVAYIDEADQLSNSLQARLNIRPGYGPDRDYSLFIFDGPFIGTEWIEYVAQRQYIPVLNSLQNVLDWNAFGARHQQRLPALLHIDTGLNRLGMPPEEYAVFREGMKNGKYPWIDWRFFMSHAAAAVEPEHPANTVQFNYVQEILKDFPDIPFSYADTDCSLLGPKYHLSMVRIGMGLFGLSKKLPQLRNCLTVYATVLQVRDLPAGSGIGYGWDFVTDKPTRIATVSCGYADGVAKHGLLSFLHFSINGKKARVLGRISMDLTVVDITGRDDVKIGDRVEVLGEEASVDAFAAASGLSFYSVLTGFTQRAKRVFLP